MRGTTAADVWREIYRVAGRCGVCPLQFTYRELVWMDQGAWEQTGWLIAQLLQPSLREGAKLTPRDVNPYTIAEDAPIRRAASRDDWKAMKKDFRAKGKP